MIWKPRTVRKPEDLTGRRFGRLVLTGKKRQVVTEKSKYWMWECKCDCGSIHEAPRSNLTRSLIRSCGCLHLESITKHGNTTHPLWKTWNMMIGRCYDARVNGFESYGGRGISVCDRWKNSFDNFVSDMGPRPDVGFTIDRIDVNGNYEPSNVRWGSRVQQYANKRNSHIVILNGQEMAFSTAIKACGYTQRSGFSWVQNHGCTWQEAANRFWEVRKS